MPKTIMGVPLPKEGDVVFIRQPCADERNRPFYPMLEQSYRVTAIRDTAEGWEADVEFVGQVLKQ